MFRQVGFETGEGQTGEGQDCGTKRTFASTATMAASAKPHLQGTRLRVPKTVVFTVAKNGSVLANHQEIGEIGANQQLSKTSLAGKAHPPFVNMT